MAYAVWQILPAGVPMNRGMSSPLTAARTGVPPASVGGGSGRMLRIAFLSPSDSANPNSLSGMPYRSRTLLEAHGFDVVAMDRHLHTPRPERLPAPVRRNVPRVAKSLWRQGWSYARLGREWSNWAAYERRKLEQSRRRAERLSREIERIEPDVIVGVYVSSILYGLQTDRPIVYFSDATARLINETYPGARKHSPGYRRLCDTYERVTMGTVHAAAFASRCARDSAIGDYGLDASRSHVIPLGAHIVPTHMEPPSETNPVSLPSRQDLKLCIIAADAKRKRVELAVRVTELLAKMGWNASLTHIGGSCRAAQRSDRVRSLGRLQLASDEDRARCERVLAESHLMILPSVGEAYGIAPCEAAHFGRPSVVSDAGGLPEVVRHEQSGLVVPVAARAEAYAEAVVSMVSDPDRYRALSNGALERARTVLNWDAWTRGMASLIETAASERAIKPASASR